MRKRLWTSFAVTLAVWFSGSCGAYGDLQTGGNNNYDRCTTGLTFAPQTPEEDDVVTVVVDEEMVSEAHWTVLGPQGTPIDYSEHQNGKQIEFQASVAGTYTVEVTILRSSGEECRASGTITVRSHSDQQDTLWFRFTPPAGSVVPRQSTPVVVYGATPERRDFALSPGVRTSIRIMDETGQPVPSTVQLGSLAGDPAWQSFYDGQTPVSLTLPPDGTYDVLVVPQDALLPALLETSKRADQLRDANFVVTQGTVVSGTVRDEQGRTLAGATLLASCGGLPSPVVQTLVSGAFAVPVRPGTCSVSVVPPAGLGYVQAILEASQDGPVVSSDATDLVWNLVLTAPPTGTVSMTFSLPDGSPAASALVTVEATDLGQVGQLEEYRGGSSTGDVWPLRGAWAKVVVLDGHGRVVLTDVPHGRYRITIEPQDRAFVSRLSVETSEDATSFQWILPEPVPVSGTVATWDEEGPHPVADAVVEAHLATGTGTVFRTRTNEDGGFSLTLPKGFTYTFVVHPSDESAASWVYEDVPVREAGPLSLGGQDGWVLVPRPLVFTGTVTMPGGPAGTLLQVFRGDWKIPLFETTLEADGQYRVVLPDPDSVPVRQTPSQ